MKRNLLSLRSLPESRELQTNSVLIFPAVNSLTSDLISFGIVWSGQVNKEVTATQAAKFISSAARGILLGRWNNSHSGKPLSNQSDIIMNGSMGRRYQTFFFTSILTVNIQKIAVLLMVVMVRRRSTEVTILRIMVLMI